MRDEEMTRCVREASSAISTFSSTLLTMATILFIFSASDAVPARDRLRA